MLLSAGARADVMDGRGRSPLHLAVKECHVPMVTMLAAAVPCFHMPPHLLRPDVLESMALADDDDWYHDEAVAKEERRPAIIAVLQRESRWGRRRPLALIREQRRAVRDAGLVHKKWEREQEEEAKRARRKM